MTGFGGGDVDGRSAGKTDDGGLGFHFSEILGSNIFRRFKNGGWAALGLLEPVGGGAGADAADGGLLDHGVAGDLVGDPGEVFSRGK